MGVAVYPIISYQFPASYHVASNHIISYHILRGHQIISNHGAWGIKSYHFLAKSYPITGAGHAGGERNTP